MNLLLLSLIIIISPLDQTDAITDYRAISGTVQLKGEKDISVLLRKFIHNNTEYLLVVNCRDLSTRIIPAKGLEPQVSTPEITRQNLERTEYVAAIKKGMERRSRIQNAGIVGFGKKLKGIHITADLCPSRLSLDRALFTTLSDYHRRNGEGPLPVALAVSGMWMKKHQKDLCWLRSLDRGGLLDITWINHSFSHRHVKSRELRHNYFFIPGTDVEDEILHTEKIMIQNGITPSVFMRFPGLVSSEAVYNRITNLGLIPVGSNAWLAKSQHPVAGSIVLVHANGNEPEGLVLLQRFFDAQMKLPVKERFSLLNLRISISSCTAPQAEQGHP